jgi:DNA primase
MAEWIEFKRIKEITSIEEIIKHYKDRFKWLERKGDYIIGCCPIHHGRGFRANLKRNIWHCFGCQADKKVGGNVLGLVAAMENVEIREAAILIAKWFKLPLKPSQKGSQRRLKASQSEEKAQNDIRYQKAQKNFPEGQINPPLTFTLKLKGDYKFYLQKRGLKPETIKYFGLGYCNRGLMKGRIAIPIHDEKGQLVAYAGRVVNEREISKENPKYKLPEGFKKSLVLFNLHRAIRKIKQKNKVILVEGFFDCFRVWQAGIENVIALMGSEMSEVQEKLIVETVGKEGRVILFFDSDVAGRECTKKVIERLVNQVYVKAIYLPNGQPDKLKEKEIKRLLSD